MIELRSFMERTRFGLRHSGFFRHSEIRHSSFL